MKILILDEYYKKFLKTFYAKNKKHGSYTETKAQLLAEKFSTSDYYSKNLEKFGVSATELIFNDEILQKKWAKEHNKYSYKYDLDKITYLKLHLKSGWLEKILAEQIYDYQPDILYCHDLSIPGSEFLTSIKKHLPVFIVGQVAYPIEFDKEKLKVYNLIFSSFPHFVARFRKLGIKSEFLKLGFEPSILRFLKKNNRQFDVTFVGGFSTRHNSESILKAVTDFWGYGLEHLSLPEEFKKKYHCEAWALDMYNIFYNSKITLNRHIDVAENHANNQRLYEATGVGAMLITDYKSDLKNIFVPGKEVETYKSGSELLEKVAYYLKNAKKRQAIAAAGQKRTLKDHTYEKRMQELVKFLEKYV